MDRLADHYRSSGKHSQRLGAALMKSRDEVWLSLTDDSKTWFDLGFPCAVCWAVPYVRLALSKTRSA